MHGMFFDCRQLKSLNLKKMKTDKVTDMSDMFSLCWHLQSLNLENFHTANVTAMIAMFSCCQELKELDLSSFDTSNVKNMSEPLPEYLAVPQGVSLKTRKANSFFRKLWEKLSN